MKFCTKCGNQLTDDAVFCPKCGMKSASADTPIRSEYEPPSHIHTSEDLNLPDTPPKLRTSMQIWMILSFILTGFFAIGTIADVSMIAGVFLFGVLGILFLVLAKTPKGSKQIFATGKISKNAFTGVSVFIAIFLFIAAISISNLSAPNNHEPVSQNQEGEQNTETATAEPASENADIPVEFSGECPVSVSGSVADNIIGYPELSCSIKNKTSKEITAIQMYFSPKDVYGEEANGIFAQNKLYSDTSIAPNGSSASSWQLIDQSVKSGDVYIYSVYFSDGTEWGDRNAPLNIIKKYAHKIQVGY